MYLEYGQNSYAQTIFQSTNQLQSRVKSHAIIQMRVGLNDWFASSTTNSNLLHSKLLQSTSQSIIQTTIRFLQWPKWHSLCKDHQIKLTLMSIDYVQAWLLKQKKRLSSFQNVSSEPAKTISLGKSVPPVWGSDGKGLASRSRHSTVWLVAPQDGQRRLE